MAKHRQLQRHALAMMLAAVATAAAAQSQESEEQVIRTEMEIRTRQTLRFEMHAGGCKANLGLEYWQKGDVAEVKSTVTNEECGASHGDYTIQVRYKGADGEMQTDEYPETWERDDAAPVVSTRLYPIGDNVDLVRVRSKGLTCTCDDGTGEDEAGEPRQE